MAEKEKVYLTREQKEAYDELESKAEGIAAEILFLFFEYRIMGNDSAVIDGIAADDLVAIAYNLKDIAIKEEFEVGELVAVKWKNHDDEEFYFVESKTKWEREFNLKPVKKEETDDVAPVEIMRKATEEEKVWIGQLGRDFVGQVLSGDVIVYDDLSTYKVRGNVNIDRFSKSRVIGIHAANSFNPIRIKNE